MPPSPLQSPQLAHLDDDDAQATTDCSDAPSPPTLKTRRSLPKQQNRFRSLKTRAISTVVLVGTFVGVIYLGHVPLMLMIFGIQYLMVNELFKLATQAQQQQQQQLRPDRRPAATSTFLQWYFFFVAAFWLYIRFVKKQLAVEITSNALLAHATGWILKGHTLISFSLYVAGFVGFVLKLRKKYYLQQFGQYAWTHLILLFVFVPSSFFVSNIFDGIIWFLLPCSLVIINDIGAYLAGIFFGRTPLIKLSPKKTWEGFFGGLLITVLAAWALAEYMSRFKWMVCPRTDLSMGWLECEPEPLFTRDRFAVRDLQWVVPHQVQYILGRGVHMLPRWLPSTPLQPIPDFEFIARPMQIHAIVLAMFASIIAPFGGFFASGFKRSFKIKDFGDSIPGHGGMTDRMDCQVVMAVFAYQWSIFMTQYY
ncbi:hypothetical protein WJX73_003570 [Symbiochloris irregularis]|uniref:Phosphatidate cytidylyltransferase n=1 Tax=Symbiochloris irregularis TaxID=706552 RepID=A0AAW1PWE7_9CHLO